MLKYIETCSRNTLNVCIKIVNINTTILRLNEQLEQQILAWFKKQ